MKEDKIEHELKKNRDIQALHEKKTKSIKKIRCYIKWDFFCL